MTVFQIELELKYETTDLQQDAIGFYDVAQALIGFERSIALVTHFVLNNEVITQAPSLKGATILASPPEAGSWSIKATVIGGVLGASYMMGTAPKDTPIGHLISSAYDYVICETLGFHVDYDKTLLKQYNEFNQRSDEKIEPPDSGRLDSLAEKCEFAVSSMHRPIIKSQTATSGAISAALAGSKKEIGEQLTKITYTQMHTIEEGTKSVRFIGKVSSFNINTGRGRIYLPDISRPVPFEITMPARSRETNTLLTENLNALAMQDQENSPFLELSGIPQNTRTGRLKNIKILKVSKISLNPS